MTQPSPTRPVDRRLLGEVRRGLEQIPDDGPAVVRQAGDGYADLAIRRSGR